jgi:hypothetical protein
MKVKSIADKVAWFLDDYITEYINPHGISISMYDDHGFVVACSLEEAPISYYEAVEILFQCEELKDLITTFNITSVKDLGKIKRQDLLALYQQGKASMFCDIGDENVDSLFYTRRGETIYISADDEQVGIAKNNLTTAREFIEETRGFYKRA